MFKPIRYATYLEAEAQEITAVRSGKKTRLRLMAAMARLLQSVSYNDVKVIDICKEAGSAKGTFFIYFKTKEEIVDELLHEYIEFEHRTMPVLDAGMERWLAVKTIVEWYELTFSVNHGLINYMVQLSSLDKSYYQLWRMRNQRLIDRWMPLIEETLNLPSAARDLLDLAVHSVGSIMDQSLFSRYGVGADHSDVDIQSPDMLIELHSLLMFRAIYGCDPGDSNIKYVAALLKKNLGGENKKDR